MTTGEFTEHLRQ